MLRNGDIVDLDNSLWVSQDCVHRNTDISHGYLRVAKTRAKRSGRTGLWSHTAVSGACYFSYDELPTSVTEVLPPEPLLRQSAVPPANDLHTLVSECVSWRYHRFMPYYDGETKNTATALSLAASIIHEATIYASTHAVSFRKSDFFKELCDLTAGMKYLPKTWRIMKDKLQSCRAGTPAEDIIQPKNKNNRSAAKYSDNGLVNSWFLELADTKKNYSAAFIYRQLRTLCTQHGIGKNPSLRWVTEKLSDPKTQYLVHQRYGYESRFGRNYRAYTPQKTAVYAGDCWQIDGTRVNIIDHKTSRGNKFLYIVAVRDVMSGVPLGWEYCYEESHTAVISALAMAAKTAGYLPYEIGYDRFPGHNTEQWKQVEQKLAVAGVKMSVTHRAEGKAHIERWFGTLQDVFMQRSEFYYGQGIKSTRRHAHRANEYIALMRAWATKHNFDFDAAAAETDNILHAYVNTPLSDYSRKFSTIDESPLELHTRSDKPHTFALSDEQYCLIFGLQKYVSPRNYMIQTQIDNATYYYGIDDCEVVERYTGKKLLNCFDPDDLSSVHLFEPDSLRYLGTFAEVVPAQRFGPDKDLRSVGRMQSIARKHEEYRTAKKDKILKGGFTEATSSADETYRFAPSPEVALLQGARIPKYSYEAAETAFLNEEWDDREEHDLSLSVLDQL